MASVSATTTYNNPHQAFLLELKKAFVKGNEIYILTGAISRAGVRLLKALIRRSPQKLKTLVIGRGDTRGYEEIAKMISELRLPKDIIKINLGYAISGSLYYLPMMHSKIYYVALDADKAVAFVGSHNVTHYAWQGDNAEASIKLEGDVNAQQFRDIKEHINKVASLSQNFDVSKIMAYAYINKLYAESSVDSRLVDNSIERYPVYILPVQIYPGRMPAPREVVYFETPRTKEFLTLPEYTTRAHIYLRVSPIAGRIREQIRNATLYAATLTMWNDVETGIQQVCEPDWIIRDISKPILQHNNKKPISPPLRGLQFNITFEERDHRRYEYFPSNSFDKLNEVEPVLSDEHVLTLEDSLGEIGPLFDPLELGDEVFTLLRQRPSKWRLIKDIIIIPKYNEIEPRQIVFSLQGKRFESNLWYAEYVRKIE